MFKKNLPLYLLIFFSTVLSIYFRLFDKLGTDFYLFWDSMVLYCGPYYFSLDKNPYGLINECSDRVSNFKYVYLPIYLEWFQFFLNVSQNLFLKIWIALITVSLLLTTLFLNKTFQFKNYFLSLLILLFGFSGIPFYGFLSGNVSIILYMLCAGGILLSTKENPTYVLIGLVLIGIPSMFKIYMLIFFLVPYLYIERKYLKYIISLCSFSSLFFFYNFYAYKKLFQEFTSNLSILPIAGDMGVGLFKIVNLINHYILNISDLYNPGRHNWNIDTTRTFNMLPDYSVAILIILLFIYLATIIRGYNFTSSKSENIRIKVSLGIKISYLCLPRMKQYDFFLNTGASFYLINSDFFRSLIIKKLNVNICRNITYFLNFSLLAFYNIKGDNFFIYPFTLLLLILFIFFHRISRKTEASLS